MRVIDGNYYNRMIGNGGRVRSMFRLKLKLSSRYASAVKLMEVIGFIKIVITIIKKFFLLIIYVFPHCNSPGSITVLESYSIY